MTRQLILISDDIFRDTKFQHLQGAAVLKKIPSGDAANPLVVGIRTLFPYVGGPSASSHIGFRHGRQFGTLYCIMGEA